MKQTSSLPSIINKVLLRKFLKEALLALSFNIGGVLAGFTIASQLGVFQLSPWAIAIYPVILTAKGVMSGLFIGRLSTALHLGTIKPKLVGNTKRFSMLLRSMLVITFETSLAMSLVSIIFGSLFWGISVGDFFNILVVVMATMLLGLVNLLLAIEVAFTSFNNGLDPDVTVYPVMSTMADIIITLCYVSTLNLFFFSNSLGRYVVAILGIILTISCLYVLPKCVHDQTFIKTIKESLLTLIIVAFVVNFTGTILRGISEIIGNKKEVYTVYPALMNTAGGVGSIIGSTATTNLFLGLLKPSFHAVKDHATRILATCAASVIMFILYSVLSLVLQGSFTLNSFLNFTILLLITNAIAVSAAVLVSLSIAILTFRKGLDPDNFVVPIESSLADSLTSIALFFALLLLGF